MKQKTKILLILILAAVLINTSVRYMLVEFPNVQESMHLENTQKHVSDACRAVHTNTPVYYTKDIVCKSIIYSAITKFIFENTKILTYIWQFPRANILSQSVLLH
nr:MAG TPA: Glycine rich protein family [Caudoviricetes sp.]